MSSSLQGYVCDICGQALSTLQSLRTHKLRHEDNTAAAIPCKLCPATFRHTQSYRKHVARVHESKQLECEQCGKTYKHQGSILFLIKSYVTCSHQTQVQSFKLQQLILLKLHEYLR